MIELKLLIDDTDYDALVERMMPMILEKSDPSELEPWARLLVLSKGLNAATVSKILSRVSKEKKDELAVRYINKNREKIAPMLEKLAADKGVRVRVLRVAAEQK